MVLVVLFWILLILWIVGMFAPMPASWSKTHQLIAAILIAILGWKQFGNPFN